MTYRARCEARRLRKLADKARRLRAFNDVIRKSWPVPSGPPVGLHYVPGLMTVPVAHARAGNSE